MSKLSPKIDIILSIIQDQLKWHEALAEFVDNSLGPDAGNADSVEITIAKDEITISDNGEGFRDINDLFQLGAGRSRQSSRDIGLYGIGSKQAQLWIGASVSVDTIREGHQHRHSFTWPVRWTRQGLTLKPHADWPDMYTGRGKPTKTAEQGTIIAITRLHPGRPRLNVDLVCQLLGLTYAPALRNGRQIQLVDRRGQRVVHTFIKPDEPKSLTDSGTFTGSIRGMGYTLFVGRQEKREARHNRLFISWGHRIITAESSPWKDQPLPSHFYGRLDLDEAWKRCLSANKLDVASYKEDLLVDALAKCKHLVELYQEYERDLKIELLLEDMSTNISKRLRRIPKSTGGHYTGGQRVRGEGGGSGGGGAREAKEGGENQAEEVDVNTFPMIIRPAKLGESADRVQPNNDGFTVELNEEIPYIVAAFREPFDKSGLWGLATSALTDHLIEARHKLASAFIDRVDARSELRAWWLKQMPAEYAQRGKQDLYGAAE